jgi:hypothetical protein
MSDMSTVIVGVVSILSCVSLITYLARPADFKVKVEYPAPAPRVPNVKAPKVAAPAPAPRPRPVRPALPTTGSWPPAPAPPPIVEPASGQPAAGEETPRTKRTATARSFLYVTKVPTRR